MKEMRFNFIKKLIIDIRVVCVYIYVFYIGYFMKLFLNVIMWIF